MGLILLTPLFRRSCNVYLQVLFFLRMEKMVIHLPHSTICDVPHPHYIQEDVPFVSSLWQPGGHKCKQGVLSLSWLAKLTF